MPFQLFNFAQQVQIYFVLTVVNSALLINLLVVLVKSVLLFSLNLAGLHDSFRLVADLILNFLTATLELFSVLYLSLEIVLEVDFVLREHFDSMINFFQPLLLSVDFLIVETKFFQPLVVHSHYFIQCLFSLAMIQFNLFKLIFRLPGFLLLCLSFSLCSLQISLSVGKISFQNHQLRLTIFKFALCRSSSILFALGLPLDLFKVSLPLSDCIGDLPHLLC